MNAAAWVFAVYGAVMTVLFLIALDRVRDFAEQVQ